MLDIFVGWKIYSIVYFILYTVDKSLLQSMKNRHF